MGKNPLSSNDKLEDYDTMDDFLFFKYLGEEGRELQQKGLLNGLGIEIKGKIKSINPKISRDTEKAKTSILDCRLRTDCGKAIDIEMQKSKTFDFEDKIISYLSKMITSSLLKGENYTVMKEAIVVVICNFDFLKSPQYHNIHILKNKNPLINEILSEKIEIHTIEMPKFRQIKKYLTKKDIYLNKQFQYLLFIDNETSHEERMEIVKMGDEGLTESMKRIEEALQDSDAFDTYLTLKIQEMHQENLMKEKMEKGKEEEKVKIAIRLKNKGIPFETIAETTGIPLSKIKKL